MRWKTPLSLRMTPMLWGDTRRFIHYLQASEASVSVQHNATLSTDADRRVSYREMTVPRSARFASPSAQMPLTSFFRPLL